MTMQDEQLFGAPPGPCKAASLNISDYADGHFGVQYFAHPTNRKDLLSLHVLCTEEQGVNTVIGAFIPLLNRSSNLTVNFARRSLWAIHNRLGAMGYEVAIRNCGREPKH